MKSPKIPTVILLIICSLFSGVNLARDGGGHGHGGGNYGGHYGGHGGYGGHYRSYGGHGGHSSFGFYLGSPFYGYGYPYNGFPYYPYYAPPTIVTVQSTPPVYIQQSPPAAQQYPAGYWYYCSNPEGYYPYVKTCPNGWQQVEPTPPAPR